MTPVMKQLDALALEHIDERTLFGTDSEFLGYVFTEYLLRIKRIIPIPTFSAIPVGHVDFNTGNAHVALTVQGGNSPGYFDQLSRIWLRDCRPFSTIVPPRPITQIYTSIVGATYYGTCEQWSLSGISLPSDRNGTIIVAIYLTLTPPGLYSTLAGTDPDNLLLPPPVLSFYELVPPITPINDGNPLREKMEGFVRRNVSLVTDFSDNRETRLEFVISETFQLRGLDVVVRCLLNDLGYDATIMLICDAGLSNMLMLNHFRDWVDLDPGLSKVFEILQGSTMYLISPLVTAAGVLAIPPTYRVDTSGFAPDVASVLQLPVQETYRLNVVLAVTGAVQFYYP